MFIEKASDSSTTVAKIMKHNKENIHHFKGIVIIFCDDIIVLKALKRAILFSSNFSH
jgi:hypothetical protein